MKKIIYSIVLIICLSSCSLFKSGKDSNAPIDHDFDPLPPAHWIEDYWTEEEGAVHNYILPYIIILTPNKTDAEVPIGSFGEKECEK